MAGPCLGLVFAHEIKATDRDLILAAIAARAERTEADDFWIDGQPFFLGQLDDGDYEPEEFGHDSVGRYLGWWPKSSLTVCAMSNSPAAHRILAQLCADLAEQMGAAIDFDGELPAEILAAPIPPIAVPYATGSDRIAVSHLGKPTFLKWWIEQPAFKLNK